VVARSELAHVRALLESGRYADALPRAVAVTSEARALAYRPLEAEALYYLGRLQEATAEYAAAATSFREAGVAAEAARNDQFAARAWIFLMWVTGGRLGKFDDARRLADEAKAKVDRLDDDVLEADYLVRLGAIHGEEGKYEAALDATSRGLALNEKVLDPLDPALASARSDLADVLMQLGKYEQALATYQQALTALDKAVGPDHPEAISTMINLAVALRRLGRHDEAVARYQRALALVERVLGADHPSAATIAISLGSIAAEQGRFDAATGHFEKALAIWSKRLGPEHANVGTVHFYLGDNWLKKGKPDQALAEFRRAEAIWSKALGADHPSVAVVRAAIGDAQRARGELALARQSYSGALAVLEKALGPEHPELTRGLVGLGLAELEAGNAGKAVALLERARKVASTADGDPLERAHAEFALARALRAAKGDPGRILSLATSARATYASRPAAATPLEAVDRFLAAK
jgi:serine/threonine-protein kinase